MSGYCPRCELDLTDTLWETYREVNSEDFEVTCPDCSYTMSVTADVTVDFFIEDAYDDEDEDDE